jgi:hypothetical protein
MDTASLLLIVLFGSIGIGFFMYGKKQRKVVPLLCGMSLVGFPIFAPNLGLLLSIGLVLVALPYFVRA